MTKPQVETDHRRSPGDRWVRLGFLQAAVIWTFVLGVLLTYLNLPPARQVCNALQAGQALLAQHRMAQTPYCDYLWTTTVHHQRGLIQRDPAHMAPGYTLYTAADRPAAILIDSEGSEVHRWEASFHSVWTETPHITGWIPDSHVFIRKAVARADGSLLALYESPAHTPNGCGLAQLDRDSGVLWATNLNTHHDFAVGATGEIYVLTHANRTTPKPGWPKLAPPIIEEFIDVLSPNGEQLSRVSLFDLLRASPFYRPLVAMADQFGDVLHSNSIDVLDAEFARHHAGIESGQLLICLRNWNLVIAVDLEQQQLVWATTGPWHWPHDPDPLPNGNFLIFDNCSARGLTSGSRVIEFSPLSGQHVWQYAGPNDAPLRSDIRSCQQRLPNGNILITESDGSRILEITRAGRVVWEYVHPVVGGEQGSLSPVICSARRYTPEELSFLKTGVDQQTDKPDANQQRTITP